jgi:hypothetical protein
VYTSCCRQGCVRVVATLSCCGSAAADFPTAAPTDCSLCEQLCCALNASPCGSCCFRCARCSRDELWGFTGSWTCSSSTSDTCAGAAARCRSCTWHPCEVQVGGPGTSSKRAAAEGPADYGAHPWRCHRDCNAGSSRCSIPCCPTGADGIADKHISSSSSGGSSSSVRS